MKPLWLSGILLLLWWNAVAGAAEEKRVFDIPAGRASDTLKRFAQQAGHQVVYPANEIEGVRTNAVRGMLTTKEGIRRLLAGTALHAVFDEKSRTFAVRRIADPND